MNKDEKKVEEKDEAVVAEETKENVETEKTEADLGLKASDDYFIPKEELITRLKDDELHFIEYIDINESYYGVKFTKNEDLFMRFYREA